MGRKKKEIITETTTTEVAIKTTKTKQKKKYIKPEIKEIKKPETKETTIFQIVTHNEVYLRAKPFLDNNNKNLVDKMIKGKVYDVISVINFSIKKMYRLKEGYYVIADEVKIV
jgi:hypothetical protein